MESDELIDILLFFIFSKGRGAARKTATEGMPILSQYTIEVYHILIFFSTFKYIYRGKIFVKDPHDCEKDVSILKRLKITTKCCGKGKKRTQNAKIFLKDFTIRC